MNRFLPYILTAFVMVGCGQSGHEDHDDHDHEAEAQEAGGHKHGDEIVLTKEQIEAAGIRTDSVCRGAFHGVIRVGGTIEAVPADEQVVVATMNGVLHCTRPMPAPGSAVTQGRTLATISAGHLQEGDPVSRARIDYEAAQREYERAGRLVGENLISQAEYDEGRRRYEQARTAYEALAGQSAQGGVAVKAGMTGYVKQWLAAEGTYVSVGQPIAVITSTRRLRLRADVPMSQAAQMDLVRSARFRPEGSEQVYSLDEMQGRLVAYSRTAAEGDAYVPMVFEMNNVGQLCPGAYADVWLLTHDSHEAMTVPVSAISEEQGLYYVYVQTHDDAFVKHEVSLGLSDGLRIEVKAGLDGNEKVVSRGTSQVRIAGASAAIPEHSHNH